MHEGKRSYVKAGVALAGARAGTPVSPGRSDDPTQFVLRNSIFLLVLPGDHSITGRFNEAVCSGGIPVLVQPTTPTVNNVGYDGPQRWVPPLDELVPFSSYGIEWLGVSKALVERLQRTSPAERDRLRGESREVCRRYFSSTGEGRPRSPLR